MKNILNKLALFLIAFSFLTIPFKLLIAQEKNGGGSSVLILAQNINQNSKDEDEEDSDETEDIQINIPKNTTSSQNGGSSTEQNTGKFQGKFYAWSAAGLKGDNDNYFNFSRLELKYFKIEGNVTFFIKANARYNSLYENESSSAQSYQQGENLRFDLPEAYINYELGFENALLQQWNLVIGLQTVKWGKADEIRPTDIISPQDITLLLLEGRNERKLGRFAIKTVFTFSEKFRFEAIWLPIQRASESTSSEDSLFSNLYLLNLGASGYAFNSTAMPEKKLSHSDVALKAYFQLFDIDFSLSFYNGYDSQPYFSVDSSGKQVTPFLNRVTMWGFDFERAIGSIVLRGEAAYFSKGRLFNVDSNSTLASKYSSNGLNVEKDYIDATIGFDKNDFLIQKFYINFQYSMNYILDYEEGMLSRLGTKKEEVTHKGIWDIYYEWNNLKYRIEFKGQYNLTDEDLMLNPKVWAKIAVQTKITLGAYLFFGDKNTELGEYKEKSFGYIQLEHLF